jgi:hypothetical protein
MTSAMETSEPGGTAQVPANGGNASESAEPAAVAAALLDSLASRPLAEHPDAYEQVHEHLSEALASIDDA